VPASAPADATARISTTGQDRLIAALALHVNTRTITVDDILHRLARPLSEAGKTGDADAFRVKAAELIRIETERQIVEAMMLFEAGRNLDDKDTEQVNKLVADRMRELVTQHGGAKAALDAKLREEGSTLEETKASLEHQYTARYFFEKKFLSTLTVTHKELWVHYQSHPAEFSTPRMARMQVAAFLDEAFSDTAVRPAGPQREARAKALAAAREALARIRAGEDFAQVVREQPSGRAAYRADQGGLLDPMPAGSFRESKVEAQAFAQAAGQVSEVIEGQSGAFIVKTVEIKAATNTAFEAAQDKIEQKIREKKYEQMQQDYFKILREKAHVVSSDNFVRDVLDLAVQQYYRGGDSVLAPARQ
jgi:parvulin-like peptidyl-prolyl isomerase